MIKQKEKYILIEPEDLIVAMQQAKSDDNELCSKLQDLFLSNQQSEEGLYKVKKNTEIDKYIRTVAGLMFEDEFITLDVIAISLARSIYECNHEMEKSLKKYFRLLVDVKINQEDDKLVIGLIQNDEKVIEYIKKYETLDDYIMATIKKRIDKSEVKEKKTTKNHSYVMM